MAETIEQIKKNNSESYSQSLKNIVDKLTTMSSKIEKVFLENGVSFNKNET